MLFIKQIVTVGGSCGLHAAILVVALFAGTIGTACSRSQPATSSNLAAREKKSGAQDLHSSSSQFCGTISHLENQSKCRALEDLPRILTCVEDELQEADSRLNKLWTKVMKLMAGSHQIRGKSFNEEGIGLLKKAQRAWIRFRDANCDAHAGPHPGAGLGWALSYNFCLWAVTEFRVRELDQLRKLLEDNVNSTSD